MQDIFIHSVHVPIYTKRIASQPMKEAKKIKDPRDYPPNNIERERRKRGWTLEQLAAAIEPPTNIAEIQKLEKQHITEGRRLTHGWMIRISKALGCRITDLLPETEAAPPIVPAGYISEEYLVRGAKIAASALQYLGEKLDNTAFLHFVLIFAPHAGEYKNNNSELHARAVRDMVKEAKQKAAS